MGNKKNILVTIGMLILTIVFLLDKIINLNTYVAVGLGFVSLILFIIYLVDFIRSNK